jgi:hypothetical protein
MEVQSNHYVFQPPPPNKWKIKWFGKDSNSMVVYIPDDVSWFHRFTTKIFFGWYWEKLD